MRKSSIRWIIGLMSLSILGLICFQAYWIHLTLKEKEKEFDQKITEVLAKIEEEMKSSEAKIFLKKFEVAGASDFKVYTDNTIKEDSLFSKYMNDHKWVAEKYDSLNLVGKSFVIASTTKESIKLPKQDTITNNKLIVRYQKKKDKLTEIINEVSLAFAFEEKSLEERLDNINIESIMDKTLIDNGMDDLNYTYTITDLSVDTVVITTSIEETQQMASFERELFKEDDHTAGLLSISIPNKTRYMLKRIRWLLLISFLLTGIMIYTFSYTILAILKQKKISKIKADFINNMTHEFKTPVATISLAIDSILHRKVKTKPEEIERLGAIIKKENNRMNQQIESLLEMALFDKEEINLDIRNLNIHDIISELHKSYELRANPEDGDIELKLNAGQAIVKADKMHIYNAIRNLVDNGIKYSRNKFKITIESTSNDQDLIIQVKDNGIGMDAETQKRVFDRFYRKTDGDIHTTKGFGLGLSYVKEIVERMKGKVIVTSKINEGSTFSIFIPLA